VEIRETALIVGLVAKGDNRKVDKETIVWWHDLIGDLSFKDAQCAVRQFRRESTEWLMPAHVRRLVAAYRAERMTAAGEIVPDVDPDDPTYFRRLRELRAAAADGRDVQKLIGRK